MAGFQLTLYGRIWVTPEDSSSVPGELLFHQAKARNIVLIACWSPVFLLNVADFKGIRADSILARDRSKHE
jgi:hypothetical protein